MIYITQLIYIVAGQENIFHHFEDIAIPIISKYKGRLLLRVRPNNDSFIEYHMDRPYEIHLVEFEALKGTIHKVFNLNSRDKIITKRNDLLLRIINPVSWHTRQKNKFMSTSGI